MNIKDMNLAADGLAMVRRAFDATASVAKASSTLNEKKASATDTLWSAAKLAYAVDGISPSEALALFGRYIAAVEDTAKEKASKDGKPASLAKAIGKDRERSWAAIKSAIRASLKAGYTPTKHATHGEAKKAEKDSRPAKGKSDTTTKVKVNGALAGTIKRLDLAIVAASGLGDAAMTELHGLLTDALNAFDEYQTKATAETGTDKAKAA